MGSISRAKRFNMARTVYCKRPKNETSIKAVSDCTGVSQSLISEIEDEKDQNNKRDVGGKKVAKLAAYYGVTTDYLLGLTDDPNPLPAATDDLRLSVEAVTAIKGGFLYPPNFRKPDKREIEYIENIKCPESLRNAATPIAVLNFFLTSDYFASILNRVCICMLAQYDRMHNREKRFEDDACAELSGLCGSIAEIRAALHKEGFNIVHISDELCASFDPLSSNHSWNRIIFQYMNCSLNEAQDRDQTEQTGN